MVAHASRGPCTPGPSSPTPARLTTENRLPLQQPTEVVALDPPVSFPRFMAPLTRAHPPLSQGCNTTASTPVPAITNWGTDAEACTCLCASIPGSTCTANPVCAGPVATSYAYGGGGGGGAGPRGCAGGGARRQATRRPPHPVSTPPPSHLPIEIASVTSAGSNNLVVCRVLASGNLGTCAVATSTNAFPLGVAVANGYVYCEWGRGRGGGSPPRAGCGGNAGGRGRRDGGEGWRPVVRARPRAPPWSGWAARRAAPAPAAAPRLDHAAPHRPSSLAATTGSNNEVQACSIVAGSGTVQGCRLTTGNSSTGPVYQLEVTNGLAYLPHRYNDWVDVCTVSGDTLGTCTTAVGNFSAPAGLALNGGYAYIANQNGFVSVCPLASDGTLGTSPTCKTSSGNGTFSAANGIAISGGYAYGVVWWGGGGGVDVAGRGGGGVAVVAWRRASRHSGQCVHPPPAATLIPSNPSPVPPLPHPQWPTTT